MAGLPSHLFVIRHGNRLDAADKRWHLSSPAPYDPPLTYGGFLQARQVGNQINSILEQAKFDAENSPRNTARRRRRFRVVIHSSPFLRCVQTSVGISAGLAQAPPDSSLKPSDLIVPVEGSPGKPDTDYRTAILRLDSYLGEWQSPEYFENITPPPGSSLLLGTAKAELLKREDYSMYTEPPPVQQKPRQSSLWSGSSSRTGSPAPENASPFATSNLSSALSGTALDDGKNYVPLRPTFAISSSGKIPDGFVAHARDECLTVDYQWDSMRPPYEFGDGGTLPEEWTTMHKRFRRGIKRMINWYANAGSPAELTSSPTKQKSNGYALDEDIETVVIIVSHGAGCNALIGAITHQPVLMDVGIASITMATRKDSLDYAVAYQNADARDSYGRPIVHVDHMYDIRISASTEHLRSSSSTPVSARSSSASIWNATGSRGRTSTIGTSTTPNQSSISFHDPLFSPGSRASSASATAGSLVRRDSASKRLGSRVSAMASTGIFSGPGGNSGNAGAPLPTTSQSGLWRPTPPPSSLRLMDDGRANDDEKENDGFPNFDQSRLSQNYSAAKPRSGTIDYVDEEDILAVKRASSGPILAAPIKIRTNWGDKELQIEKKEKIAPQEVTITHQLEDGMGGLWGQPQPPGEAERLRDMSHIKRRWTVNEKSR